MSTADPPERPPLSLIRADDAADAAKDPEAAPPAPAVPPLGLPPRSEALRRFMVAPIVVASALALATGLLVFLAWRGGTAAGPRLTVRFTTACPAAAQPVLAARADAIGLGDPIVEVEPDGLKLTATMPGLADDAVAVPALLARPGKFSGTAGGELIVDSSHLTGAQIRLDESGMPYTWVGLSPAGAAAVRGLATADPEGALEMALDDDRPTPRPNDIELEDEGLRIITEAGVTEQRMRTAADRAILLGTAPLPCPMQVAGTAPAEG
ncbi:MAG: hypothetical protein JNM72_14685 [Deltaproteobacteria bacterium]|nr:hypothetical protein [Deltaproteobacteria bacterium]